MKTIFYVTAKELKDYFASPIAYIVIAVFLLVSGWLFFSTFFLFNQASLRNYFDLLPISLSFVIPAVTMGLLAEERSSGSWELLLTLPVTTRTVVIAKFLAATVVSTAMISPVLIYALCISLIGDLDWAVVLTGYAGAILLSAAYCSIGLLASSLTRNQIIAFILAMVFCFLIAVIDKMLFFMPRSLVEPLAYLAADTHFQNIAKGIIDSRDLVYFAGLVWAALYATDFILESSQ